MTLHEALRLAFPNLRSFEETSKPDAKYNCIAWAACDDTQWWEPFPRPYPGIYWPAIAPREKTLAAYEAAYASLGYRACSDGSMENEYQKVAIFVGTDNRPTHAARQLSDGRWTSKLGESIDIAHRDPEALEGPQYGTVAKYMKRAKTAV